MNHRPSTVPLVQYRRGRNLHGIAPYKLVALACAAVVHGCAGVDHTRGMVQLMQGQPEEAIQSLGDAARKAPTNANYKVDYLMQRDLHVQDLLPLADDLRADGKFAEARIAYERILNLDAGNARAAAGIATLQQDLRYEKMLIQGEAFLDQSKLELALDRANQVLEDHPRNRRAAKLKERAMDARATTELALANDRAARSVLDAPVTLQLRDATLRNVFESLSKATGMNILFDRDVKQDAKATIFVKDVSISDVIDLILLQNQLEKRVVNGNTMMIYPASAAKQAEYEDLTIRSFQITNADIKYLSTMLKTMLKLKEVAADERTGIMVLRDTAERLRLAEKLIAVHDMPDPEIMLEVEVLEVSTTRTSNLGVKFPNTFGVTTPGTASTLTLGALEALKRSQLLVTPLTTTLNFKLEDAEARILASPRIRSRNKEKAKIMIGDRVPTVTNTVTPISTGSSVVTGSVSYQDVGLKLEFEPQVYSENEVGIKISLEVSNIAQEFTDPQGGRSYQIGTRNASTNLRLKDGETQILGGLITDQDRNTASKIPGLGHLPIVGRIFGNNDGMANRSEIILAITPRIVRNLAIFTPETKSIFSGTANVLRERPILADPATIRITGTFGGAFTPATGPDASTSASQPGRLPAARPLANTPLQAPAAGQPLINPMPTQPSQTPTPSSSGTPMLPPPPPMIQRPASAPF